VRAATAAGVVRTFERGTRVIDHDIHSSMERKKSEGYF
jgi:hypothetical protein